MIKAKKDRASQKKFRVFYDQPGRVKEGDSDLTQRFTLRQAKSYYAIELFGERDGLLRGVDDKVQAAVSHQSLSEILLVWRQIEADTFELDVEGRAINRYDEIRAADAGFAAMAGRMPDGRVALHETPAGKLALLFAFELVSLGWRVMVVLVDRMDPRPELGLIKGAHQSEEVRAEL